MSAEFNNQSPRRVGDIDKPVLVQRVTRDQKIYLLASILADQGLFTAARARLKPEHFDQPEETAFRILWATACRLVDQYSIREFFADRQKTRTILDTECMSALAADPDSNQFAFGELAGFLNWFYGQCQPQQFSPTHGTHLFTAFLLERSVSDPFRRLSAATQGTNIANMAVLAKKMAEQERDILSLNGDPVESFAPNDWMPAETLKRPTGIVWLDELLRGGHRAPEVYSLLGAIGAGKTTFGLQLCHSVATQELFLASPYGKQARCSIGLEPDAPYEMGHVYYFHYEMSKEDIRKKMWSHASMIDLDRIELLGQRGFSLAANYDNLAESDKALLQLATSQLTNAGLPGFLSERDRLEVAKRTLNGNFWQINMTGDEVRTRGTGEINEIEGILDAERAKGRRVALVVIDYASACVERHTMDEKKVYQLLSTFGRRCEHQIGVPFKTPVWVMQQLSGASNSRSAASRPHHSDAMGSKRFAENCWFGFNLGTVDEATGCRYFTVTKARRANLGRPPILKIAGGFNRLIDVSNQYRFDGRGRAVPAERTK